MRTVASILVAFLVLTACGAAAREKTLSATLLGVNAARDGFVAYDRATEREIVATHTDRATYDAAIAKHRARVDKVVRGFEVAYQALAIAALSNEPKTLTTALAAALHAKQLLDALRGGGQ